MSNPVFVTCKKNVWKLVASDVVSGQIWKADRKPNVYIHTYRTHGGTAPTLKDEGMPIFIDGISENISASSGIDVYIMSIEDNGKVRVDL